MSKINEPNPCPARLSGVGKIEPRGTAKGTSGKLQLDELDIQHWHDVLLGTMTLTARLSNKEILNVPPAV